jgi:hypothetical protein
MKKRVVRFFAGVLLIYSFTGDMFGSIGVSLPVLGM